MRHLRAAIALLLVSCTVQAGATIKHRNEEQAAINSEAAFHEWLERYTTRREAGPLAPRNDCDKLPGATSFVRDLARAVWKRDARAVSLFALPDVQLGFGGESGRAQFLAKLRADNASGMRELHALLPLGCAPDGAGGLVLPWYAAQDLGSADAFSAMVIVGRRVPLRKAANPRGVIKARLDWQLVELVGGLEPDARWQHVRTLGGTEGYMETAMLRSVLATRIVATRRNGQWRIEAIAEGD
jgi:hypothetical protein